MWELDHKEGWAPKNWCFWTVVLEKTLESPLHCKEIKPVNPKGNQLWIFIGRTDDEGVAPILWPPHVKSWLIGKDPDAGKDWKQEEKGITEDKMVGWHHLLDGHEILQALGDGEGQGSLQTAVHGVIKSQTWLSSSNNNHPDWCTLLLSTTLHLPTVVPLPLLGENTTLGSTPSCCLHRKVLTPLSYGAAGNPEELYGRQQLKGNRRFPGEAAACLSFH